MSFTNPRTWSDGEVANASELNSNIRDNFNALLPVRQGGDSANWSTLGTNNYSGQFPILQMGVTSLSFAGVSTQTATVTFPVAFSNKPIVLVSYSSIGHVTGGDFGSVMQIGTSSPTTTQFSVTVEFTLACTKTVVVQWIAYGPQ